MKQVVQSKGKKCVIMQPTFMPWLGYFDLIHSADIFVFLDDVQLAKRSWQVRNKVKTVNGELFITLPVKKQDHRDDQFINNSFIAADTKWRNKALKTLELNYSKTPYFEDIFPLFQEWVSSSLPLSEIHSKMIIKIANALNFNDVEFVKSSSLKITGNKETKLLEICKLLSASSYLSPQGSSDYIQPLLLAEKFKESGIELYYHDYKLQNYKQMHGEFIPSLGVLDVLFNCGFNDASGIIIDGHRKDINFKKLHTYDHKQ